MEIKRMSFEQDGKLMAEFFRNVFSAPPWNDDWSDEEQLMWYIRDISSCFNSINFGFYEGEKLIALSMGNKRHWWGGTEYVIEELCVASEEQGRGVGTEFLKAIEGEVKKDGMKQFYLCTEKNVPAFQFYVKNGFESLDNHVSFFKEF